MCDRSRITGEKLESKRDKGTRSLGVSRRSCLLRQQRSSSLFSKKCIGMMNETRKQKIREMMRKKMAGEIVMVETRSMRKKRLREEKEARALVRYTRMVFDMFPVDSPVGSRLIRYADEVIPMWEYGHRHGWTLEEVYTDYLGYISDDEGKVAKMARTGTGSR